MNNLHYILKYVSIICFKLIIPFSITAQSVRFPSDRDNKAILELNYQPERKINLPVNEIEILDARFNQSYIGVTTGVNVLNNNEFTRQDVIFPVKFDVYLKNKLTDWFKLSSTSDDKLIILVKKFRTNDQIKKMLMSSRRKEVLFLFSASFFLQRNGKCYRLTSIEKWYSSDHLPNGQYSVKKDYHEWLMTNVLIQEIMQVRFTIHNNTASFTRSEVDKGIQQRFIIPVMREKIKKGIYPTYGDFLLNTPSDTNFRVAVNKSKILFLDTAGHVLNSTNAWAVSDGKMTVFMFGQNFYEIELKGNFIRIRTFRKLSNRKPVTIINDLYSMGLISKKVRRAFAYSDMPDYLDIDMDTGELFLEEIIGPYKLTTVTEAVRDY